MKAREIREHFLQHADWVDRDRTVDTFKHGDPEVEVRSAAVMWMLTNEAVERVRELGANLVVAHEPTFFGHFDDAEEVKDDPVYLAKRRRLDEAGLTVLRIHDSWDVWPEIGVGASLARLLGLRLAQERDPVRRCYAVEPTTLEGFARSVRAKLGMDAVSMMGDPGRMVRRVGLAFGMIAGIPSMQAFLAMKPDVILAGELCHWRDVRYLEDAGAALVLTDHAASENPGMKSLAQFLEKQFRIPAHYVEVGSPFRTVTA